MRRSAGALALGSCLAVAPASATDPVALGRCAPVARPFDAIELAAGDLQRLGGTPIARLGVVAFRDGRGAPIPFQVDERRGRKLALPGGPEPTADDRPEVLDADDLVVFMACDAGEQASPERLQALGATTAWREIRVHDPLAGRTGFAYLVVADRPPATDRVYVAYDPATDLVRTARYRVGLVSALPVYLALAERGSFGPNLIDGLRLRAEATFLANLARWTLNERQGSHALAAWKAGPVRVVRRSRHGVVLPLGIEITAATAHTYFYAEHVWGPGSMKLPFSPGVFFRDIRALGGADGRDLRGWRYHAPGVPGRGFPVDGRTDAAEAALDASGDWFALARPHEALLFVTRLSENLRRAVSLRLVYLDDAARPNPPEAIPGTVPLVGLEAGGVERIPGGRYTFSLHIFALDRYRRGDEAGILAGLDAPLAATTAPAGPAAVPAAPR